MVSELAQRPGGNIVLCGPARCKMCKMMHDNAELCGKCWGWYCATDEPRHRCIVDANGVRA